MAKHTIRPTYSVAVPSTGIAPTDTDRPGRLDIAAGSGITLSGTRSGTTTTLTIASTVAAAPSSASYVTTQAETGLSNEKVLTGTTNQVAVTAGAGTVTLSTPQDIHTGATPTFAGEKLSDNLVLPKTSGKGIQVEEASPTFPWRDITGSITARGTGANNPPWNAYRGSINAYEFNALPGTMKEVWITLHLPHDYLPGSDLYIHTHWSQNVVDTGGAAGVPGVVKWYFAISYADGFGTPGGAADPFTAPIIVSVTQQASTTQYGHMIAEAQFTNNGGTGGLIDSNTISVDGLLLIRCYRDSADAADTLNQSPFLHMVDVHYQSTNIGTKGRAPNFYV